MTEKSIPVYTKKDGIHKLQINFRAAGERKILYSIPDRVRSVIGEHPEHSLFPVPRVGDHVSIKDEVSGGKYDYGLVSEVIWSYRRRDPANHINVRFGDPADTIHADVILVPASEPF